MPEAKYNQDELVPPSFINKEFVVDLVKSVESDPELQLITHEIKPGTNAGDHYASIMFKIIVTYETKGRSVESRRFILKTVPESGGKKDFLDEFPLFGNEIRVYTKTLPAMETILQKHGIKVFWPKLVYHIETPQVLVFDDLTHENFEMIHHPQSLDKIGLIIEKIAIYHALSMVIAEQSDQSELVAKYNGAWTGDQMKPIMQSMINQAKALGTEVKSWPGMKDIGSKIENHIDEIFENFGNSYTKPNTWGYNVLNHGDFHIRNMMFHKDPFSSEIDDVMFLDFQVPLYMSPGLDLIYLMNSVGNGNVRENRLKLLKIYHTELVKFLTLFELKGNIPSIVDINVEVLNLAGFDAFQVLAFVPVFRLDLTGVELGDLFNTDVVNPTEAAMKLMWKEPAFIDEMTNSLVYLDNLGVFDF